MHEDVGENPDHLRGENEMKVEEDRAKEGEVGERERRSQPALCHCTQCRRCTPYRGSRLSRTSIWNKTIHRFVKY